ncbi:MAG: leucyl aminopeptidase [Meiothermus sp.]|uniref:leucyl aminopeptidase n=1 Tax=Meiothermus sp. TaxID=1955249 RepID=UPI0025CCF476|nr:leucyl aminopeptidase [Meiothermus sp.]MCS7057957.1 leucyl aminopeptidase [Meiothermus sp.]MCS7193683.1 leucyl aminopeptidase [Meiothermus sp.]MDW8091321.1 leucyl aminopeptidase [Meiothermus sp.]MDW8481615.1 leucyl aminopeptidase [Meiothermus sp.]
MELTLKSARRSLDEIHAPLAVVGVWGGELSEEGRRLDIQHRGRLSRAMEALHFRGEFGETLLVSLEEGREPGFALLFGLGKKRGVSLETVRQAGARLVREVARLGFREAVAETFLAEKFGKREASYALAEGAFLGGYRWSGYKTEVRRAERLRLWLARSSGPAVARAEVVAEAVNYARNLVNEPPNILTPVELARRAEGMAQELGLQVEVWDEGRIQEAGMGAFYAVAQGSANPPRFIQLTYRPEGPAERVVALVGKGLTFDTGGYSLKPSESQITMKGDMAGAAAVLAAMRAIAKLKPPVEVRAYVAAAENMVSGRAYRVSDVLKSLSGKTIEVLNTDAEGRLTLADAITYADRQGAQAIVELSTLTGACVVALGEKVAGLFANDPRWGREVREAAERAGEKVWPLPLEEEYREMLRSETADLKNTHGRSRSAGAITAALFLSEFTEKPLAHLDIAGPAYSEKEHPLGPAGGTGFGVRTLVELLSRQ